MSYPDFLARHGYPQSLVDIARGLVEVPDYTLDSPPDFSYGFPPALIPLWSNASWPGYIGILRHWFGDLPGTCVKFYVETHTFVEIARNPEQLKAWLVFDFLCNVPEPSEVERFAQSIGFCLPHEVESVFRHCQTPSDLASLAVFQQDLPAVFSQESDCGMPAYWSVATDPRSIDELVQANRPDIAWLKLNSIVTRRQETLETLEKLYPAIADKPAFTELMNCWKSSNA